MDILIDLLRMLPAHDVLVLLCTVIVSFLALTRKIAHNRKAARNVAAFFRDLLQLQQRGTTGPRVLVKPRPSTRQPAPIISFEERRKAKQTASSQTKERTLTPAHQAEVRSYVQMMTRASEGRKSSRVFDMTIYARIWKQFGVASYCDVPDRRFGELMQFLRNEFLVILSEEAEQ